jgi:hypothetical protein
MTKSFPVDRRYNKNIINLRFLSKEAYILLFLLFLLQVFATSLKAQPQSVVFTSSGTWTVPEGVSQITVEAWGGGGGGAALGINNNKSGGGGGAYAKSLLTLPAGSYSVTVGAGGSSGTGGGISSFGNLVIADGGSAGTQNSGGSGGLASASVGQVKYNGGNGAGAPGGGGSSAGRYAPGNNASGRIGGAAPDYGGKGGSIPSAANNVNGENGSSPGGGGAGRNGPGNGTSASGASGQVIISWCHPPQINNHPSDQNIIYGHHASFTVLADYAEAAYQWEFSDDGGNSWSILNGETGTILYINVPSVAMSGYKYRCKVSSSGCGFIYSNVALLTVGKADAKVNIIPYQVIYNGMEHLSTGTATGVSGEALQGLDLSSTRHTNAGIYTDIWTFTDETGNYNNQTGSIENIISPKNLIIQANNQVKCYGELFTFTGYEFTVAGLVADESIERVMLASHGAASDAVPGTYQVVPSEASDDNFNPSNYNITYLAGEMAVKHAPSLSGAEQLAPVCEGTFAVIRITGLIPEKIFSLDYSINGIQQPSKTGLISDISGNSSFVTSILSAENNNQILRITSITHNSDLPYCSQTFSVDVILEVNQLPGVSGATAEAAVCEGNPVTVHLTGLLQSYSFLLYYSINDVEQEPVGNLVADESGNASFQTALLSLDNDGKILSIYRIENQENGCYRQISFGFALEVTPGAIGGSATATHETLFWGGSTVLNLTGYNGEVQWQQFSDGSTGWINAIGGIGGSSESFLTSGLTRTTLYRAKVVNGICPPVYSNEVTITVSDNFFNVFAVTPASVCNAAEGVINFNDDEVTTEVSFKVEMTTGYDGFSPDWEFTFTLSSFSEAVINEVTAGSGNLSFNEGIYTLTGLTSYSGEGSATIAMEVTGGPYRLENVVLTIDTARELMYNAPDVDSSDHEAIQIINPIPETSDIITN